MFHELTTALLVTVTVVTSIWAFQSPALMERWIFRPKEILADKEYWRIVTSGFLHADWPHLAFNLFSLASFGSAIESYHGPVTLLTVYFAAIIGGSLLSLYQHRHHDYAALGASGGVCGVIYACIFLVPGSGVSMLFLPIAIPAWAYGVGYLLVSFLAMRRGGDNIGHDAHIGGAIVGLLAATALHPWIVAASPKTYAAVMAVSVGILWVLWKDPFRLWDEKLARTPTRKGNQRYQRYDEAKARNEKLAEMDRLLDKVSAQGLDKLSSRERAWLEQLSREIR